MHSRHDIFISFLDVLERYGFTQFSYQKYFNLLFVCQGVFIVSKIHTKMLMALCRIKTPSKHEYLFQYQISLSLLYVNPQGPPLWLWDVVLRFSCHAICLKYHLFHIEDGSMVSIAVGHHDPLYSTSSVLFQCSSWLMHRRWLHGQHS